MFLRFLIFFVSAYLFFYFLHWFLTWRKHRRGLRSKDHLSAPEEMVLDPQCQSYLPKGEAILRQGHYFCSEECAKLYLAR